MRYSYLNKYRKYIFIALFFSVFFESICSYAQNGPPIYTDYLNFKSIINPSFVGREKVFTVFIGGNLLSSEKTGVLAITTPIRSTRWSVGLINYYDEIGISKNINISPSVSYTLPLGEDGQELRFGLTGTYNNLTNDYTKLIIAPDLFLSGQESYQYFSFGAGISLYLKNTVFSISVPEIYSKGIGENRLFRIRRGDIIQSFSNIFVMQKIKLNRTLYLYPSLTAYISDFDDLGNFMLYGNLALSYDKLTFGFTALLKNTSYNPVIASSLGGSLSIDINDRLSLGYSYRNLSLKKLQSFSNIHSLFFKFTLITTKQLRHNSYVF